MGTLYYGAIEQHPAWFEAIQADEASPEEGNTLFVRDPRVRARALTGPMAIFIICGDCGGDDLMPRKTLLAKDGTCEVCGGHSYVLASIFFLSITSGNEPSTRLSQQRQILALAEAVGLIFKLESGGWEIARYRAFLLERYGVETTVRMNNAERASLITALTLMKREYDEI